MITPQLFTFFSELAENNNREWFEENKPRFKSIEGDIKVFLSQVTQGLTEHDRIEKAKMFRIYRDVRFSKNKTPYKTHFGLAFHREKPALRGGYYIHLESGNSFLGVGFWGPNSEDLFRIRKELEIDAEEFRALMAEPEFKKYWGGLEGEEVKTAPKGFSKDHPNIDLIKKKQFVFIKKLTDKAVLSPNLLSVVDVHFKKNNFRFFFF